MYSQVKSTSCFIAKHANCASLWQQRSTETEKLCNLVSWKFHAEFKMANFLLGLGHGTRRRYCKFGDVPINFYTSRWNVLQRLLIWNFLWGTIEPSCHTQAQDPHQIKTLTASDVYANFINLTASLALQKGLHVSWQNIPIRSLETQKLSNLASHMFGS